jgi:hypothetical protein
VDASSFVCVVILSVYLTLHFVISSLMAGTFQCIRLLDIYHGAFTTLLLLAGGIPPNALQPAEAYCDNPAFWFPRSSQEALHVRRRERPLSAKGGIIGGK